VTFVDEINGVETWRYNRHILCLSLFVCGIILPYWKLDDEVLLMSIVFWEDFLLGPH